MTEDTRRVVAHLGACFGACYEALGTAAPTLGEDAAVVRAFEAGRAFGELTLATRDYLGEAVESLGPVVEVLERSVAEDPTGRLCLFCLGLVVGPRLLVSLRDARGVVDDEARPLLDCASDLIVSQILAIRDLGEASGEDAEGPAADAARALSRFLEDAGYADSLGIGL